MSRLINAADIKTAITNAPDATSLAGTEKQLVEQGGELKKATLNLFAARRTADLQDINTLVGTELIPAYLASSGLEGRVALKELGRLFTGGIINPKLPPYNCKGDARRVRDAVSTAGSKVLTSASGVFQASDVGKMMCLSNAGTSYGPMQTTIESYQGPTQVTLTNAAVSSHGSNECIWGSDDTTGMAAALAAAASPGTYVYGGVVDLGAGWYLVGPQVFSARMAIVGKGPRQSGFVRKPTLTTSALLKNNANTDDFPTLVGFGLDGARYCQNYGYASRLLEYISVTSGVSLPQIDPYPYFDALHLFEGSSDGMYLQNRNSGNVKGVDIFSCWGVGAYLDCYDCNIVNLLAIANRKAGVDIVSGNNNINNLKCSFNGDQDSPSGAGFTVDSCNLRVRGSGNNITNCRLQESPGDNLVIEGPRNTFGDLSCDDTGCMRLEHSTGPQTVRSIRAGIRFFSANAVDNIIRAKVSYQVHGTSRATHAVFMSNNASYNQIEVFTPHDMTYDSTGAGSGGAAAGVTGYDSSGGYGSTNRTVVNGTQVNP